MTISFEIFGVHGAEMMCEMHRLSFHDNSWSEGNIASLLQSSGTYALVVSKKQQPLGFILWREAADEAEILTLCILPEHRVKGIASQLLQKFYDKTKSNGIREIFLEVNENNQAAVSLYEKNGFKTVGRRKNYYGGRGVQKQNALILIYSE